jgi:hypothetical protein
VTEPPFSRPPDPAGPQPWYDPSAARPSTEAGPQTVAAASVVALVLGLVALFGAFVATTSFLTLGPALVLAALTLLAAATGGWLAGRSVMRGDRGITNVIALLVAGATIPLSAGFLLTMTDPVEREYYSCIFDATTIEEASACDLAYNSSSF